MNIKEKEVNDLIKKVGIAITKNNDINNPAKE